MESRLEIEVKVSLFDECNILRMYQKGAAPEDNNFFFQIERNNLLNTLTEIYVKDHATYSNCVRGSISLKETRVFQDNFLKLIDEEGVSQIKLGDLVLHGMHFPNGEVGLAIGNNRFLLNAESALQLRNFCAKILN